MQKSFCSGFVSIIGRPNVGKSTLMNTLIGEKISIVTNKPQTTRNKILSVLTKDDFQMVFIDTPGIHKPKNKLGEFMLKSAERTLNEVDVILFLVEPHKTVPEIENSIIEKLSSVKTPVILAVNKIDTTEKTVLLATIDQYQQKYPFAEILLISALQGENMNELLTAIQKVLPAGPKYFPDDMLTDQPERQICSEIIREKALLLLQDEIPHGIAVEIQSMKAREDKDIVDMEATIYCEKDSHKGMIIGKNGAKLKDIGTRARVDIENLLGSKINLQLWVKIKNNWRDSDFLIKNFGYSEKNR